MTGRNSSASARGQATIIASVPFSAPDGPPLTGASTAVMPFFASPSATSLATRGPVVERSMKVFAFVPSITPPLPSATALTMSGVGRLTSTVSHCEATSAGGRRALGAALLQPRHRGLVGVEDGDCVAGLEQAARHVNAHAADAHKAELLVRHNASRAAWRVCVRAFV